MAMSTGLYQKKAGRKKGHAGDNLGTVMSRLCNRLLPVLIKNNESVGRRTKNQKIKTKCRKLYQLNQVVEILFVRKVDFLTKALFSFFYCIITYSEHQCHIF